MTLTLGMITTNSLEPVKLATWWADQVGGEVADPYGGSYLLVSGGPVRWRSSRSPTPPPARTGSTST